MTDYYPKTIALIEKAIDEGKYVAERIETPWAENTYSLHIQIPDTKTPKIEFWWRDREDNFFQIKSGWKIFSKSEPFYPKVDLTTTLAPIFERLKIEASEKWAAIDKQSDNKIAEIMKDRL